MTDDAAGRGVGRRSPSNIGMLQTIGTIGLIEILRVSRIWKSLLLVSIPFLFREMRS